MTIKKRKTYYNRDPAFTESKMPWDQEMGDILFILNKTYFRVYIHRTNEQ